MSEQKSNTTLDQFRLQIKEYSEKHFGKRDDPIGPLNHLKGEVDELLEALGKDNEEEEWADCILLLFDAFRIRFGDISFEVFLDIGLKKLDAIKDLKWNKEPNEDGTFSREK